jgi:peptidyl-prolyl cis-trans isomerase A (cyclophilin A)
VVVARVLTLASDGTEVDPGVNRPTRIRFEGRNLHSGLVPEASGRCDVVVPIGDALETRLDFGCTPSAVGPLTVALKDADAVVGTYDGSVKEPLVLMRTSLGDLTIELNTTKAPLTAQNFLRYVDDGYYSNTVFHRVIDDFMVQGGGFLVSNGSLVQKGGTYPPIALERTTVTGLSNVAGTLAMARTNVENSATSQFFINTVDNLFLDGSLNAAGYAVFGRVVVGAGTTLQALRDVPVQSNGQELSLPLNPPVIISATRVR